MPTRSAGSTGRAARSSASRRWRAASWWSRTPAGGYTALDPQTGRAEGEGYVLRGSIAPAAGPVAFGPDRLFAPLNDGTVMLLSLDQLRGP